MTDKLISFKTAKLAKEIGFDIQTYSDCWVKTLDGDIIHNSERKDTPEHDRCEQYLMQPTQTVLQEYLREKHNIEVYVVPSSQTEKLYYAYYGKIKNIKYVSRYIPFSKYSDALGVGLYNALKLIKKLKK